MIASQPSLNVKRITVYTAVLLLLVLGRILVGQSGWFGSATLHMLVEFVSATLALFVGTLALVRFYTKRSSVYFFVGAGFLGAGLLDAYHAVRTVPILNLLDPTTITPELWQWNSSPIFLSILIAGSWMIWQRDKQHQLPLRQYYVVIGAVALVGLFIFALIPQPAITSSEYLPGRITAVFATVFFLIGLIGYLYKREWIEDTFENWLIIALMINVASQGLFMFFARTPFDALFDTAVLLKQIGYLCVLVGLLSSMYTIFNEAEEAARSQRNVNEALQREIVERKRAEAAEQEHRNLAEALRQVGLALNSTLDFDLLLNNFLDQIGPVLRYDTANIMLVHKDEIEIVVTRGYDLSKELRQPRHFHINSRPSLLKIVETAEPLIIPDTYEAGKLWVDAELSPHVRSWAGAPIIVEGEVVAFLALNYSEPGFYQPENAARLKDFAIQAAIAFENADLYQQLQKRVAELTTLNRISQAITSTLDLTETLTIITQNTTELLKVAAASVVLHDKEANDLWFAAASGEASEFVQGKRLALGQGILGWVAQTGEPLLVQDTATDPRYFGDFDEQSGFQAHSILCVPLLVKAQPIGAIEAINKENGTFDEEDLRLLTRLAVPAATAIENAQLFAQSQQEITERKRAEAALEIERAHLARRVEERTTDLRTANAELARANRMKDEFLASVSHELRTPLNAVLGISEALQEGVFGEMNEKQISSLRSVEESGRHLLELINDILDLSKAEAGKLELEMALTSVESVCKASLRMVKQNAHKKRLRIHSSYDSNVTSLVADERRVKQVLVNLLSNAVKFTPEGGEIGLEVMGDEEAHAILITVWDTGIGIAKEHLEQLFRPFVQLDSRLSREYAGTGLGLSLVLRMVELHGGSVLVQSEVGKGSRFTVSFPWHPTGEKQEELADADLLDTPPYLGPWHTVVIVEDSPSAQAQLKRYFDASGVQVRLFAEGKVAKASILADPPDLVVLDLFLPDSSGLVLLSELRDQPQTAELPVLVVSVMDDQARVMEAGADYCLMKPFTRAQMHMALQVVAVKRNGFVRKDAAVSQPVILLAEDHEANIITFSSYLKGKGFDLVLARNGVEAVARAGSDKPDLIVMDIQMPKMNGLDAIRKIREHEDTAVSQIPIIAVTALAMPGDEEACLEAGANGYLSKPVSLRRLLETIEAHLVEDAQKRVVTV
ncbi:response regulator [Candidatus Leptofilum sp.]|uniref:response regulator n=1 Tax=Candidatus Leptofilum sp. TaxID=3241576 RepID=UPI003B58C19F